MCRAYAGGAPPRIGGQHADAGQPAGDQRRLGLEQLRKLGLALGAHAAVGRGDGQCPRHLAVGQPDGDADPGELGMTMPGLTWPREVSTRAQASFR